MMPNSSRSASRAYVLSDMLSNEKKMRQRRALHISRHDPDAVATGRANRLLEKAARRPMRLRLEVESDQLWFAGSLAADG